MQALPPKLSNCLTTPAQPHPDATIRAVDCGRREAKVF